ncbi:tellurium resistance protein TerC [Nocardia rhizosphaerihabitans]|uniref:Tellurium resistance protein TerC n=1 Tax=Nocardia rhizosphaerihabitans TaxID=1691570 RepID=A0ABQ2KHS4_9NOCA|nr:tellurium resistance protein TerC [Nocardia rhizosphaerihabitans]
MLAVILVMLAVDLFAHRKAHVVSVREAAIWSGVWVALAVAFGTGIWWWWGGEFAAQYFAGYVIEKSLAVDNVFVFAVIFSYFAVPREYQHRVLFYGVLGALVFRGVFIAAGSILIASFAWILYVFGAFLVVTGIKMARHSDETIDPDKSLVLRGFRRMVPMTDGYRGQHFWVKEGGRWLATPLLAVLVLVETTDIVFAVDSIPAIFAVTSEPFLVFTSNAFAILGLRAMYFMLADLMHRFIYLKLGLAVVLVWVGVKMLLLEIYKIPTTLSLAVVIAILAVAVTASWTRTRTSPTDPADPGHRGEAAPTGEKMAGDTEEVGAPAHGKTLIDPTLLTPTGPDGGDRKP